MSENVNVTIRMNPDIKKQADILFDELGFSFSTAVNMFIRKCLRVGGIPFDASIDDDETSLILALLCINSDEVTIEDLVALRDSLKSSIMIVPDSRLMLTKKKDHNKWFFYF